MEHSMTDPIAYVVVPCYNEGTRLSPAPFLAFLRANPACRICLVNDGSTDGTAERMGEIAEQIPERVMMLDLPVNVGKGEAVRAGVNAVLAENKPDYVGYWDADLATPLTEFPAFLASASEQEDRRFI